MYIINVIHLQQMQISNINKITKYHITFKL